MRHRKIYLVLALLFSVCALFAQSEIDVEVENTTDSIYVCSVQFNQSSAIPTTGSTVFTVHANTTHTEHFEFDENDVNLKEIKCYLATGTSPDAYIAVSSGTGTVVDIAPLINSNFYNFEFFYINGSGTYEHVTFTIYP